MSAERRFNDRDVRENPRYEKVAVKYLRKYQGEFDFLVDLKMRAASGRGLTVPQVRGVLNCMRNDPRLPDGWWKKAKRGKKKKKKKGTPHLATVSLLHEAVRPRPEPRARLVCDMIGVEHDAHGLRDDEGYISRCWGWHAINRDWRTARARFHLPYVRGRSSNLVHRSTHEGTVEWWPDFHGTGMAEARHWTVKTACRLAPLKDPTTLDKAGVEAAEPYEGPSVSAKYDTVTLCSRCFPTGEPT